MLDCIKRAAVILKDTIFQNLIIFASIALKPKEQANMVPQIY